MMDALTQKEIENLTHTLIDLKTILKCDQTTINHCQEILNRINPRIDFLEDRLNRVIIKTGQETILDG